MPKLPDPAQNLFCGTRVEAFSKSRLVKLGIGVTRLVPSEFKMLARFSEKNSLVLKSAVDEEGK